MQPPFLQPATREVILDVLSANLEEPVTQILRQVHDAFAALLEALFTQQQVAQQLQLAAPPGCGPGSAEAFALAAAVPLLGMPATRKGRYAPLAALASRLSVRVLLERQPALVQQTMEACGDDVTLNAATAFLRVLLQQLRVEAARSRGSSLEAGASGRDGSSGRGGSAAEAAVNGTSTVNSTAQACHSKCSSNDMSSSSNNKQSVRSNAAQATPPASSEGLQHWCASWMPALLAVMLGTDSQARIHAAAHALPVVLKMEPQLLPILISKIVDHGSISRNTRSRPSGSSTCDELQPDAGSRAAALVLLLKVARQLQLLGDLDGLGVLARGAASAAEQGPGLALQQLLLDAVSSSSAALRLECLELACINPK